MQLSYILFGFPRGVLLEVLDLALDAPKCAMSHVLLAERGAVGGA